MRPALSLTAAFAGLALACQSGAPQTGGTAGEGSQAEKYPVCERLFGLPSESTGLPEGLCSPVCASCEGSESFSAPSYSEADIATLRSYRLAEPPELLGESPYETPEDFPERADRVCALSFQADGSYSLQSYEDAAAAGEDGAQVTHEGACGACSSLQDLSVYIETPDLTTPVRRCGIQNLNSSVEELIECIEYLGFTQACAEIWAFNTKHTREECLEPCLSALEEPYHLEDGSPNDCIQCDEDTSGSVFKAVSGRTRRNSGLPTALCRPCDGVAHLEHRYSSP